MNNLIKQLIAIIILIFVFMSDLSLNDHVSFHFFLKSTIMDVGGVLVLLICLPLAFGRDVSKITQFTSLLIASFGVASLIRVTHRFWIFIYALYQA